MRPVIALALLTATAEASPVPQPLARQCEVSIPRAPEELRVAIEDWVHAEPKCGMPLEVRAIPTDGGYYLFARDAEGRVRERIVPDAQSAGVLVASWVADDAAPVDYPLLASEVEPVETAAPSVAATAPVSQRRARWFSLGGVQRIESGGGRGVRGELDLKTSGAWSLGVAMSISTSNMLLSAGADFGSLEARDVRALATATRTVRFDSVDVRFSGGIGAVRSSVGGWISGSTMTGDFTTTTLGPVAELSAQASLRLGRRWALAAGPVVTWYVKPEMIATVTDEYAFGGAQSSEERIERQAIEVSLVAAVRAKL